MLLTIGQLADRTRIGIQTIRYYERHGLLTVESRTEAGYRLYGVQSVRRVAFIRNAKALGFSLREIAELLALRLNGTGRCEDVRRKAVTKLHEVETRIHHLQRIRDSLRSLSEVCEDSAGIDECPILEALVPEEEGEESHAQR